MTRPLLSSLDLWVRHERRCLEVLIAALGQFAVPDARESESELNRRLYFAILEAARAIERRDGVELPVVVPEGLNPPLASDSERAAREFKRPDFYWAYHDHDGDEPARQFVVECKRLARASRDWVYTAQYVSAGVVRFVTLEHGYGKSARSGAMVGYLQGIDADSALTEINEYLGSAELPEITYCGDRAADPVALDHFLYRPFPDSPFRLRHFWRA